MATDENRLAAERRMAEWTRILDVRDGIPLMLEGGRASSRL